MKRILNFCVLALLPTIITAQNTAQNVDDACTQAFTGIAGFVVGMSSGAALPFLPANDCIAANDIDVAANSDFTINRITFNMEQGLGPESTSGLTFDVYLFENNGGVPGTLVTQQLDIVPFSIQPASIGGFDVVIDLPTTVTLSNSTSTLKKYWLGLGTDIVPNGDNMGTASYWVSSEYVPNNASYPAMMRWNGVWEVWDGSGTAPQVEGLFIVEGDCNTLGVANYDRNSFKYYPNPVTDFLKIESDAIIKEISIYNYVGQIVGQNLYVINGQLDMSSLPSGIYVITTLFQDNQTQVLKVVKK